MRIFLCEEKDPDSERFPVPEQVPVPDSVPEQVPDLVLDPDPRVLG